MDIYYLLCFINTVYLLFNIFKIDNSSLFPYTKDAFTLYKRVTSQYKDSKVLNYVKQCVPEKITLELQMSNNATDEIQILKPLLQWFKNDFMKWMPKSIICERCKKPMYFENIQGNSWKLRAIENYSCANCKFQTTFPRIRNNKGDCRL